MLACRHCSVLSLYLSCFFFVATYVACMLSWARTELFLAMSQRHASMCIIYTLHNLDDMVWFKYYVRPSFFLPVSFVFVRSLGQQSCDTVSQSPSIVNNAHFSEWRLAVNQRRLYRKTVQGHQMPEEKKTMMRSQHTISWFFHLFRLSSNRVVCTSGDRLCRPIHS